MTESGSDGKRRSSSYRYAIEAIESIPDDGKTRASKLVRERYKDYLGKRKGKSNNALNGSVFEFLVEEQLRSLSIDAVLYRQATFRRVSPTTKYDFVLFDDEAPVVISCKTSARERWRQAELEAQAAKKVFPQAYCVLVLYKNDSNDLKNHLRSRRSGLDDVVLISDEELTAEDFSSGIISFDDFLKCLTQRVYTARNIEKPLATHEGKAELTKKNSTELGRSGAIKAIFEDKFESVELAEKVLKKHPRCKGFPKNVNDFLKKVEDGSVTLKEMGGLAEALGGSFEYGFFDLTGIKSEAIKKELKALKAGSEEPKNAR